MTPFDAAAREAFVRDNLRPHAVAGVEGLRLYRAHTASGLSRLADLVESDAGAGPPYWSQLWPGGAVLLSWLLDRPDTVRGRRVLDWGAGSGAVGLLAADLGAARTVCCDADPMARAAIRANAALNGTSVEVVATPSPDDVFDVVLAGDVFYDPGPATAALTALRRFAATGAEVLIGDIGRAHLPGSLTPLATYPVRDVGDRPDAPLHDGHIYRLT